MTIYLKQSTASQEVPLGYFVDSTDGNTEETGLTIANTDIKIWKTGATTLANKNSGGATHISNGVYYAVLDDTDTNTLGSLVVFVHVSGALAVRLECVVLAANIYDSIIGGGDVLDVSVTQFGGTNGTFSSGRPEVNTTHAAGTAWGSGAITAASIASNAITSAKVATDAIGAAQLASDAVTEIQSGLATSSALSTAQTDITSIKGATILATGTAQAGGTFSITLAAGANSNDDVYEGQMVSVVSGTGAGQTRLITAYNGTTKVASTTSLWAINPDNTSVYVIHPHSWVAAVTGNVYGDVSGNVDGNVVGSVSSVTFPVGVDNFGGDYTAVTNLTNQYNGTGYSDGNAPATQSALATAQTDLDTLTGSDGVTLATSQPNYAPSKAGDAMSISTTGLARMFSQDSGTTYGSAVSGSVVKEIADNAGGASLTVQDIVDGVFDEAAGAHTGILATAIPAILDDTGTSGVVVAGTPDVNVTQWRGSTPNNLRNGRLDAITNLASGTAQAGANGSITLAAGASSTTDLYKGQLVTIDSSTGSPQTRLITAYDGSTKIATITPNWTTNPGVSSTYIIHPQGYVLAVDGLTASNLDATISSRLASASYTAPLDAAGTRTAVGLASANLDTQLGTLATSSSLSTVGSNVSAIKAVTDVLPDSGALTSLAQGSDLATVDGNVDAIKAKTDSLTFTVSGQVDSNIQYVNDVQVTGDGQTGTEWGPA